jgi:hypothetical protein
MTIQLEMFEDSKDSKELKPIDYSKPIGMYKELKDVKGVQDLSEDCLSILHYLYLNHSRPEDGFIPAKVLAGLFGYHDTRDIRKCCTEIDMKTELVVYASQHGYKLASNEYEIDQAVRFALAPALTTIKRVIAKSKNESKAKIMQGYIGNMEKLYGGIAQGQQQADENMDLSTVSHYPDQPFKEHVLPIGQRIQAYVKSQDSKRK